MRRGIAQLSGLFTSPFCSSRLAWFLILIPRFGILEECLLPHTTAPRPANPEPAANPTRRMPRPSGHATRDAHEIEDPYDLPFPDRNPSFSLMRQTQ